MELQQIVIYTVIKIPSQLEISKRPFLKICVQSQNLTWKRFEFFKIYKQNTKILICKVHLQIFPFMKNFDNEKY